MNPVGKKDLNQKVKNISKSTTKSISNMGAPKNLRHQRNFRSDHYSMTSDTLYSIDGGEMVNYKQPTQNSRSKSRRSRETRKTAKKNILAYSLLDRSIDNTISMLEKSKKKEIQELDLCKFLIF